MYVIKDNFTYVLITIHNDMHMSHIYAMLEHQDVSFQRDLLLLLQPHAQLPPYPRF